MAAHQRKDAEEILARAAIKEKLSSLLLGDAPPPPLLDLFCLRDEIVHFIPVMTQRDNVPPWLANLSAQGLFLCEPDVTEKDGYLNFVDRLCSYRLAYWAFETTESFLVLLHARQKSAGPKIANDLKIVRRFRSLAAPGELPE